MNKFRNEKLIKLGEVEILLRPTFEAIAMVEADLGSLATLAHKMSKGNILLTDCAKIVYYCQTGRKPEDPSLRLHSLEDIWGMIQEEGMAPILPPILEFFTGITLGNKLAPQLSDSQKKN